MRKTLAIFALLVTCPLAQAGRVEVRFVAPDSYADTNRGDDAEQTRQELAHHLVQLGQRMLPPQQSLMFEVLDIDLAGEVLRPSRIHPEPRVLMGKTDWPAITLRYVLTEDGRTLRQGEERVTDMNYMGRERLTAGRDTEPLAYEKRMLEEWFRARLAP